MTDAQIIGNSANPTITITQNGTGPILSTAGITIGNAGGMISTAAPTSTTPTLTGTPYAGPGLGGNLVQNGDFSNGSVGWTLAAGETVDTNPADAPPGSSTCLKRVANSAGTGSYQVFPVLPNTTYTIGMYGKSDGTNSVILVTYQENAVGVNVSQVNLPTITSSVWTFVTQTFTTAGNVAQINVSTFSGAAGTFYFGKIGIVQGSTYTDAMFSPNPLGNKSLVACEATTNLLSDGDCEGVGGTTTAVLFNDSFANANAWTTVLGSAPTAASNILTIPANSKASFGHPDWWDTQASGGASSCQIRFQPQAGFTDIYFEPIYIDSNHQVYVDLTGSNMILSQNDNGTVTALSTTACSIAAGTSYWFTWSRTGNALTISVRADGASPGAVIATNTTTVTISSFTYGKCAVYPVGAAVLLGQMGATAYSGVCQVSGPVPSGFVFNINSGTPAACWSKAQSFSGNYSLSVYNNDGASGGYWNVITTSVTAQPYTSSGRVKTLTGTTGTAYFPYTIGTVGGSITGTTDWTAGTVTHNATGTTITVTHYLNGVGTAYWDCIGLENKGYSTLSLDPFPAFFVPTGARAAAYATAAVNVPSSIFTLAATIRTSSTSGDFIPVALRAVGASWAVPTVILQITNVVQVDYTQHGSEAGSATPAIVAGSIYRFVIAANQGTLSYYLNNVLVGSYSYDFSTAMMLLEIGLGFGGYIYDGSISGLVIANHAWSAAEVASDYANLNPPGLISGGGLYLQPGMLYAQAPDATASSLSLPAATVGRHHVDSAHAGVARIGSVQPLPGQTTVGIQGATIDAAGLLQSGGMKKLAGQSIGTSQTTIAHALGRTPQIVMLKSKSNGTVWESANADATNIYLTASTTTTVDVFCA